MSEAPISITRRTLVKQASAAGAGLLIGACLPARALARKPNLLTKAKSEFEPLVTEVTPGLVIAAVDVLHGVEGVLYLGDRYTGGFGPPYVPPGSGSHPMVTYPPRPWTSATVFALESITKVFTSIIFAQAIDAGMLAANDYIDGYLPAGAKLMPGIADKITLGMLANYTSQFPNSPSNWPINPKTGQRDAAEYTLSEFVRYLNKFSPDPSKIGTSYEYSSLAFGLLGYILTNLYGASDYNELVQTRIAEQIGLTHTTVASATTPGLATGYSNGKPTPPTPIAPFLGGGGALWSTGPDMLRVLRVLLNARRSPVPMRRPLERAIALTEDPTFVAHPAREESVGMAWGIRGKPGATKSYFKDGIGSGFASVLALVPGDGLGLFAAGNTDTGLMNHLVSGTVSLLGVRVFET